MKDKNIPIAGIQKLSMVDFEEKICATIFTRGCMFKCPYCHNADLIEINYTSDISETDILSYLSKRKNILDAVCISGGEPLLHSNIDNLLRKIKNLGYLIKLDTNGNNPDKLKELYHNGLIDYVAMDIKNTFKKYPLTINCEFPLEKIRESINWLLEDHIDYEFRTTIVKPYHTINDLIEISQYIKNCKRYFIQNFQDNICINNKELSCFSDEELENILINIQKNIPNAKIRGKF